MVLVNRLEKIMLKNNGVRRGTESPFPPKTRSINLKGCALSHLDLFLLYPSPATLPKPISPSFFYTARACRHFIAATGDMVGDGGVDNAFWGEGMAEEMKQR